MEQLREQIIQDINMIPECDLRFVSVMIKDFMDNRADDIMPPLVEYDREKAIDDAIAYRKAGGTFITAEESLARLKQTIERVVGHEIEI